MGDFCDQASAHELQLRDDALAAQRERAQRIADSFTPPIAPELRRCEECGELIGVDRLRAYSQASRCIECSTAWEKKNSHYARRP